ncbi:MAG: HlyD family efflux transporter periplasmic adaptor subunit [Bacteroidales bacterium]|nr:HlyD family efflux transporter periplasmic adaptor subunit [Bacteroidales bacterium]
MKKTLLYLCGLTLLTACNQSPFDYDASGVLEADELVISAQADGEIMAFDIEEGDAVTAHTAVGYIDTTQLYLQKCLLLQGQKATNSQRPDINKQVAATRAALEHARSEAKRLERLRKAEAATQQQIDDIRAQIKQLNAQLDAQVAAMERNITGIDAQSSAQDIQIAQIDDRIYKSLIKSPIDGVVLQKYAEAGELTGSGRPLMKVARLETMTLKAYVSAPQLSRIRLGSPATVYAYCNESYQAYEGVVTFIADRAEFTPKTIQTQDERTNLVYAVKIRVPNTDGLLKAGMYADVAFQAAAQN